MSNSAVSERVMNHSARGAGPDDLSTSALPVWLILCLPMLCAFSVGMAVATFRTAGKDWWVLLRDPATAFGFAPYAGLFSHVGVLMMTAAGAVLIFTAALLPRAARLTALYAGAFTLWLAVDDLFLLHESLIPRLLGLPEPLVLALYAFIALGLIWVIGSAVFSRHYLAFWASGAFLGVMLITDIAVTTPTSATFLLEETTKIIGFALWAAFWIAEARSRLLRVQKNPVVGGF